MSGGPSDRRRLADLGGTRRVLKERRDSRLSRANVGGYRVSRLANINIERRRWYEIASGGRLKRPEKKGGVKLRMKLKLKVLGWYRIMNNIRGRENG